MKSRFAVSAALVAAFSIVAIPVHAAGEPQPEKGAFGILLENDWFGNADHDYTNGIELTYTTAPQATPNWLIDAAHLLPFFTATGKAMCARAMRSARICSPH